MTRTAAREIAVTLSFSASFAGGDAGSALDSFFEPEYYDTLARVDEMYSQYPDEAQMQYIRTLVEGVARRAGELDGFIEKYSRGWKIGRISKIAAAILRCAVYEILYVDDVPAAAAINEAVELAKGYEEPETVAFINGVLGSFVRSETEQTPEPPDTGEEA